MRCGCGELGCNCVVQAGEGILVTGAGSVLSPYVVAADGGGGGDVHDGVGARSTITTLSTDSPTAAGGDAVAIGSFAIADGDESVALGTAAESPGERSIAIGVGVVVPGDLTVGIGTGASGSDIIGDHSVAIGLGAQADGFEAISIMGSGYDDGSVSIGVGSNASTAGTIHNTIAIGYNAYAENGGVSVGYGTESWAESICIGYNARGEQGIRNTVVGAEAATGATVDTSTVIGYNAQADHDNAVALGANAATTGIGQVNTGAKPLFSGCPASAPADALLIASQFSVSVNEAGNLLTFKVKYADGTTVKSGTVALA